jgi:hypothetical protein
MEAVVFIKIDCSFYSHPKVKKLARRLGVKQHQVVGILVYLWTWAMTYRQDGDLHEVDPVDLFDGLDFEGNRQSLFSLLKECGFIDDEALHNWGVHYEKVKIARELTKARVQKHREKNSVTRYSVTDDVTCNAACNNVTLQTKTKTKTKIKTKIKNKKKEDVSDRPSVAASTPGSQVWSAYVQAMEQCWNLTPPRSAKASSQAAKLVELVGLETALKLAAYYPTRRSDYYVRTGHPFGILLTDYMAMLREVNAGIKLTKGVVKEIVSKEESENACRFDQVRKETNIGLMTDEEFAEWEREQELLLAVKQNPMLQESTDGNECDTVF